MKILAIGDPHGDMDALKKINYENVDLPIVLHGSEANLNRKPLNDWSYCFLANVRKAWFFAGFW